MIGCRMMIRHAGMAWPSCVLAWTGQDSGGETMGNPIYRPAANVVEQVRTRCLDITVS